MRDAGSGLRDHHHRAGVPLHRGHTGHRGCSMRLEHVVEIDMRLRRASEKHGAFADASHMWGALDLEHREVHEAVQDRDHDALRDELFDLVTVALRYLEATE